MLLRTGVASVVAVMAAVAGLAVLPAGAQSYDPSRDPKTQQAAAEIEQTRKHADAAAGQLAGVLREQEALNEDLDRTTRERDTAAATLASLRSGAARLALSRYVQDASSLDTTLVAGGDPSLAVRAATYLQVVTGQTRDAEGELRAAREDLEARSAVLQSQQARLRDTEEALAAAQVRLQRELVRLQEAERRRQAEAAVAAEVARRRAEEARRAAAAEAGRQAQATAAAAAAAAAAARTGGGAGGGAPGAARAASAAAPEVVAVQAVAAPVASGMFCPVQGATAFSDTWGDPRAGRWGHEGVDLMGSSGQPILAAESGTTRHTRSPSGGNQVWLYGDSGTAYFYAHLSSYAGGPGRVSAGEVIGGMGMTGRTGAVHLHFEIRPGRGRAVNPYPAVRAAC